MLQSLADRLSKVIKEVFADKYLKKAFYLLVEIDCLSRCE